MLTRYSPIRTEAASIDDEQVEFCGLKSIKMSYFDIVCVIYLVVGEDVGDIVRHVTDDPRAPRGEEYD